MSTMATDYKDRYFNNLDKTLGRIESKVDANTQLTLRVKEHAEKTNGRVGVLEKEVFGKIKPSDLPPFYRDPKVISIVFNISLAILILVAAATKIDLTRLLP